MIGPAKRCPEDVEFLCRMAWEFGAAYFDAIWRQREVEQDERNKASAIERERLGARMVATRKTPDKQNPKEPDQQSKPIGVIARGEIAACV